jgi:hypothetical protein
MELASNPACITGIPPALANLSILLPPRDGRTGAAAPNPAVTSVEYVFGRPRTSTHGPNAQRPGRWPGGHRAGVGRVRKDGQAKSPQIAERRARRHQPDAGMRGMAADAARQEAAVQARGHQGKARQSQDEPEGADVDASLTSMPRFARKGG